MRRFSSFWLQCAGIAARGNSAFANDWQWLVGYPAIAVALWFAGYFYAELSGRIEVTLSTAGLGVLAAAAAAFVITWLSAFLVRLANAPISLFFAEKKRADESDAKLSAIASNGLPTRNVCLGEAVSYVSFREWGRTFLEAMALRNAPLVKANPAYDHFLQAIADGEVPVWGKRFQGEVHEPIENSFWFDNRLDFLSLARKEAISESSDHIGTKATSYTHLMTSRETVERYWPRVGDTGPRAVSALQISFGMDHAYTHANTRNLHQYERIYSFRLTNRGPKTLSECRVIVESVDVDTGIVFPQVLAKEIKLAPGDHVFVPFVSYGEPMNTAIGDTGDSFTCLATVEPKPFFDVGENVLVKLRATGIDTLPHEAQCRMWVDENGRLQIQDE
jgi:hypothetical protein